MLYEIFIHTENLGTLEIHEAMKKITLDNCNLIYRQAEKDPW